MNLSGDALLLNHQEDVYLIPTGGELSISDYRNLIVSRTTI